MIINYYLLTTALVLLWVPRQWLHRWQKITDRDPRSKLLKPMGASYYSNKSHDLKSELSNLRNWIDLTRAGTGALAINYVCFPTPSDAGKIVVALIFVFKCIILVFAVIVQTIRKQDRVRLVAPIFFIQGLSFGLIGWPSALFSSITAWTCNRMIPSAAIFLILFAGIEFGFGLFLARDYIENIGLCITLAMVPIFYSRATQRSLVLLHKTRRKTLS